MALTRDFKETIRARVRRDPGFRKALLREGIENFLSGQEKIRPPFGAFQEFVDECLIGLRLFSSQPAELGEKPRSNADGNQLLGVTGHGPAGGNLPLWAY